MASGNWNFKAAEAIKQKQIALVFAADGGFEGAMIERPNESFSDAIRQLVERGRLVVMVEPCEVHRGVLETRVDVTHIRRG